MSTTSPTPPTSSTPYFFHASTATSLQMWACLAGGAAFAGLLVLIFLLSLLAPGKGNPTLPGIIGGASVLPIGLLSRGIFLLRAINGARVDEVGVTLDTVFSRRTVPWSAVQAIERDTRSGLFGVKTQLVHLFDGRHKKLATLSDAIERFPEMVSAMRDLWAAQSPAARAVDFEALDKAAGVRQYRRSRKLLLVLVPLLLLLFGGGFFFTLNEYLHTRRFVNEAKQADARIDRHWMQSVTPRVVYTFKAADGKEYEQDVSLKQDAWDALEGQKTIPVEYLPTAPAWNRPLRGRDTDDEVGLPMVFLCAGGFGFFLVLGVFTFLGYDLDTTGNITTLSRHGQVLRTWGVPPKQPPMPGAPL